MNVVFNLADESLNDEFLAKARERNIVNIQRTSHCRRHEGFLWHNAVTIEATEKLAEFMKDFKASH